MDSPLLSRYLDMEDTPFLHSLEPSYTKDLQWDTIYENQSSDLIGDTPLDMAYPTTNSNSTSNSFFNNAYLPYAPETDIPEPTILPQTTTSPSSDEAIILPHPHTPNTTPPISKTKKRQEHLQRNRVAASKSRAKKKVREGHLEARFRELSSRNHTLEGEVNALQSEMLSLEEELVRHALCGDGFINSHVRSRRESIQSMQSMNSVQSGGSE